MGILVGSLLCFTNCYFGLQSSWISMSSLQAALIGYGIVKGAQALAARLWSSSSQVAARDPPSRLWRWYGTGPLTPQENVVLQTTAVACGAMPLTVGLIGIVPALLQIKPSRDHGEEPVVLTDGRLVLWSAALAFFGVFFASPLRKRVIIKEKLPFPSGTATAHLIGVLHNVRLRSDDGEGKDDGDDGDDDEHLAASERGERQPLLNGSSGRVYNGNDSHTSSGSSGAANDSGAASDDANAAVLRGSRGWHTLLYALCVSLAFTIASSLFPVLYAIPLFDLLPPHNLASRWGWYFTPSLSYVGQGVIMGFHTTASMLAGAIFGWAFLSPLAHHRGWTDSEQPMDSERGAKAWILWVSLAVMTSESLVGLVGVVGSELRVSEWRVGDWRDWLSKNKGRTRRPSRSLFEGSSRVRRARMGRRRGSASVEDDDDNRDSPAALDLARDEPPSRLPPPLVITLGIIVSSVLTLVAFGWLFGSQGIASYTTVVAIVLAFVLSILAVRSLGTTDLNPVAALGKISQLIFALLQPHHIVANLVAGGISEAGAMQAGELMQDFKTGHLLRASPRAQFYGQLVGSAVGILVSSFAYQLYMRVYTIPSASFPAPAATMWLNFARLVNDGEIPRHSAPWLIGSALVFGLSGAVKAFAARRRGGTAAAAPADDALSRAISYLPSGVAFAVGILNTPNFSIARFIGGVLSVVAARTNQPRILVIILASGFVLGEGAGSIMNLFAKQAGVWGTVSCAGCRGSCGGGC